MPGAAPHGSNHFLIVLATGGVIAAANLLTYFYFTPLAWSVNYFHFLPVGFLIFFLAGFACTVHVAANDSLEPCIKALASFAERRKIASTAAVIVGFGVVSYLLRVQVPLLGDSFIIIRNYQNTFAGSHELYVAREPLAIWFFYFVAKVLGTTTYPSMLNAFLVGEFVLGTGVIIFLRIIADSLFEEPRDRLLAFFLLLTPVYVQLFFGYVEIYSVVMFTLTLFVLLCILNLKGRISLVWVFLSSILLFWTHYLTVIIDPSLLFLVYYQYKRKGLKEIVLAIEIAFAVFVLAVLVSGIDLMKLLAPLGESHLLDLKMTGDTYQAYTLFSPIHFSEVLNLFLLHCPFIVLLIPLIRQYVLNPKEIPALHIFLLLGGGCLIFFMSTVKFDLGAATDWDTVAAWFLMIQILIALEIARIDKPYRGRIFAFVIMFSVLHTGFWSYLNSSEKPNIDRVKSFMDDRILSPGGTYAAVFHLHCYYEALKDSAAMYALWEPFVAKYPDQVDGYRGLVYSLTPSEKNLAKLLPAIEKWLAVEPDNLEAQNDCALVCGIAGAKAYRERDNEQAEQYFVKAFRYDSTHALHCAELGEFYFHTERRSEARYYLEKAIALDPKYISAMIDLSSIYIDSQDYQGAIALCRRVLRLDQRNSDAYLNLGISLVKTKNRSDGIDYITRAGELGNVRASQYLKQNGPSQ
jgi:tetratricopeptide (TPR) repeat protein